MLKLQGMSVQVKTRCTYWRSRPRSFKMRRAMLMACSWRMSGMMMRIWQCLLGVFGWLAVLGSGPPGPVPPLLGPFTVTGDCLSEGPSPIHIHWSRWLLALTDTATAPGLPRWPHLKRYQVGAANIQSPSLRHDGDRMISASNFSLIYLAIVASVSKNKWHLVANFQPYIFRLLWDSCLVLLPPTWE